MDKYNSAKGKRGGKKKAANKDFAHTRVTRDDSEAERHARHTEEWRMKRRAKKDASFTVQNS